MNEFNYDAFISYSHRDMAWARWLQRRLETFPVPRGLAEGETTRRRLRVFRDQTDLAGVELQTSLEKELRSARYLIVLCSPNSAASHWVNEEVKAFRSFRGGEYIIPFIVEGEPGSDESALECYPPALREGGDPLGANVQEIGKDKAFLKLVSILLGIRFNRLVDREKRRRTRTALIAGLTAGAVILSTSVLLWRNAVVKRQNQALSYDIYGAALLSISQKDIPDPEDVEFLLTSAQAGNATAMVFLADCYLHGKGTEQDETAAFDWYVRAAEAGDTVAMVAVGNCYADGTGTAPDPAAAHAWNIRAAEAGEAAAMVNAAIGYEDGLGTERDESAALHWYEKAARAGYDLGMYNLARCYMAGIGTQADPEQAFVWMEALAGIGNTLGMYNLGLMYQYGYGTEEDPRLAYEWYRRAAENGDPDGMYMAGWCLENGYGVEDPALDWYRRAAEAGSEAAAGEIARLEAENPPEAEDPGEEDPIGR